MDKVYSQKYNTPEYRKKYTGLYGSWYAMKQRCSNPNNKQYKDYGGRGITYPRQWEVFSDFKEDMGGSYSRGLTLDRIDNNKGYSVKNCRWATRKEQNRNKRCSILLSHCGSTYPLIVWAEKLGIDFGTLRSRFYRGMKPQDILKPSLYRPAKLLTNHNYL